MTTTYCTPTDVSKFLGLGANYFTESSKPTYSEVEDIINAQEDYIDRMTDMAWREKQANDGAYEYHSGFLWGYRFRINLWFGNPILLRYRRVKPLDPSKGDALEYYNGSQWVSFIDQTDDYWLDSDRGILYLNKYIPPSYYRQPSIRIKYRYGYDTVSQDIKLCCILLTAAHLASITEHLFLLPEGGTQVLTMGEKIAQWNAQAERILAYRRELTSIGD